MQPVAAATSTPIYEVSTYISHLFTSDHFHLEMCELTVDDDPHFYEIYLQGYVVPTWQGIFYARHFFYLIGSQINDLSTSINSLFDDDDYYLYIARRPVPQELDGDVLFPDHPREPIWQPIYTHPVYNLAFKFRFLVTSLSRTLPFEIRHAQYFRNVDAQCLDAEYLLHLLASLESNPFLRSLN